jgi:Arylsulfotransferase (ASST)
LPRPAPSNATIADQVIEELTPSGNLVWSWDTAKHIPLTETDPQWYQTILNPTGPALSPGYDNYHFNSVEEIGDDVLISYRALDAVYLINKVTGKIIWKLGGVKQPESLRIVGDPVFASGSGFGGQHYARFNGGNTNSITLHDNGTGRNRPPRAVRYTISNHTATLQESVTAGDPLAAGSACCGSAAELPGGDWVMSWGFTPIIVELSPLGRQFLLQWLDKGEFSYRAEPVLPGVLSINALRSGMNAQFPR